MRSVSAVATLAALLLGAPGAHAHALLVNATPAVGSTVAQPPSEVVIVFSESVEPRFSSIVVQDAAGSRVDTGAAHIQGDATHLAVALKPLPPGAYAVTWHAISTDTHRTQGRFSFTVSP